MFQQNKNPKHKSKRANLVYAFQNNDLEFLSWPTQSPDLNPIENLRKIVKTALRGKNSYKDRLWELVSEAAKNIIETC